MHLRLSPSGHISQAQYATCLAVELNLSRQALGKNETSDKIS